MLFNEFSKGELVFFFFFIGSGILIFGQTISLYDYKIFWQILHNLSNTNTTIFYNNTNTNTIIFYIITSYMKCCECWRYGLTWIHYFVALKESKSSATILLRDNLWMVKLWTHNFIFTTHSHSKIMTKLWKNLWYLIYSFKEDEVVGSTISILIRGGSVNLLILSLFLSQHSVLWNVHCTPYPLRALTAESYWFFWISKRRSLSSRDYGYISLLQRQN